MLMANPTTDQMSLNDLFEDTFVTTAIPSPFRVDDSDRATAANPQAIGFGAIDAALPGQIQFFQSILEKVPRCQRSFSVAAFRFRRVGTQKDVPLDLGDVKRVRDGFKFMVHESITSTSPTQRSINYDKERARNRN